MALKQINPIDPDQLNIENSLPEIDVDQGEEAWFDRSIVSVDQSFSGNYTSSVKIANGDILFFSSNNYVLRYSADGVYTETEVTGIGSVKAAFYDSNEDVYVVGTYEINRVNQTSFATSLVYDTTDVIGAAGIDSQAENIILTKSGVGFVSYNIDGDIATNLEYAGLPDLRCVAVDGSGNAHALGDEPIMYTANLVDDAVIETTMPSGDFDPQWRCAEYISGKVYMAGTSGTPICYYDPYGTDAPEAISYGSSTGAIIGSDNGVLFAGSNLVNINKTTLEVTLLGVPAENETFYQTASQLDAHGNFIAAGTNLSGGSQSMLFHGMTSVEDQVVYEDDNNLYQCTVDTYDNPIVGSGLTPPSWVYVSKSNKYRALDYTLNSKSELEDDGWFTFAPDQICTTISLFGAENINTVTIEVRSGSSTGTVLYTETQSLVIPAPSDDMIANPDYLSDKVIFDDLPTDSNPFIRVTFTSDSDAVLIGSIALGNARTLGLELVDTSTSRTSYDTIETDSWGNETTVSRPSAEYTTYELSVPSEYSDYVERILAETLNVPCVYVCDKPDDKKLFTLGRYERSPLTYTNRINCTTTLKVRGLT